MAKQKQPKEPKAPKSKQVWIKDVYIIGYGKVFAGEPVEDVAIAAIKSAGAELSKHAE